MVQLNLDRKIIINMCPTGMIPTKEMNLHVPLSPSEIGKAVSLCDQIKPSIVHIHPRDGNGKPTWKPSIYKKIVDDIRKHREDILFCATTSGRLWPSFEHRSALLDLTGDYKPEMASLTLGSNNFARTSSCNSPQMIRDLASKMRDNGIKPELEVFEPGMICTANHLMEKGIISTDSPYFNILLDSPGTSPLHPSVFAAFYSLLPQNAIWSVAGIGKNQTSANIAALSFGGHIRVGLEDNLYTYHKGEPKITTNHNLINRLRNVFEILDIEPATSQETKEMLNI